jgi:hypothetical protein
MRDELYGRMWVENHEAISQGIDSAIAKIRIGLARLASWDGTSHQLLALVAAFAITSLTFNTTAA